MHPFLTKLLLIAAMTLGTSGSASAEEATRIPGGRIVLCGLFQQTSSGWTLDTGKAGGVIRLSFSTAIQPLAGGGCVAGPELPFVADGELEFAATHARFLGAGTTSVDDVQAFTGAVRVCGQVIFDRPLLAIRFGTGPGHIVSIPSSPRADELKKGPRLNDPVCAYGKSLPAPDSSGELIFPADDFHNDRNRSGFSVGN